jgi:beta-lactamase class A
MTAQRSGAQPRLTHGMAGRRQVLLGLCASVAAAATSAAGASAASSASSVVAEELRTLERQTGGRIGLAACSTAGGALISHRADERFAMCSTFKLMLAAAILARVDAGQLRLDLPMHYSRDSLLAHSPVTLAHVDQGALPLEDMARAVVEESDNTAANALLALIGGPQAYTRFLRTLGDRVTRLDRIELALNSNLPNDVRDTTAPSAMLADMNQVLIGRTLSAESRERLLGWLRDCSTGRERLRAQLPPGWSAGDKTGTGNRGANNDLAIFWPPSGAPILVACFLTDSQQPAAVLNAAHARIGAAVANALA